MKTLAIIASMAGGLAVTPGVMSGQQDARRMAAVGTVNYIEGQVSINGNPLTAQQSGQIGVQPNDSLTTASGKAEILLSPGAFLRLGNNSEVRLLSSDLVDPRIEVVRGEAMLEVDQKIKNAHLDVMERGADASVLKPGLYRFDNNRGDIEVIDGQLQVMENGRSKEMGRGKEVLLNGSADLKTVGFDRKGQEDDLYAWSNIRSNYLAEANASTARYIYAGGWPYSGMGWYWNPYYAMYSWLPGDGFFYSPFGYPFFSVGYEPYYRGWYGRGGFVGGRGGRSGVAFAPHTSAMVGGFRSGGFARGGHR